MRGQNNGWSKLMVKKKSAKLTWIPLKSDTVAAPPFFFVVPRTCRVQQKAACLCGPRWSAAVGPAALRRGRQWMPGVWLFLNKSFMMDLSSARGQKKTKKQCCPHPKKREKTKILYRSSKQWNTKFQVYIFFMPHPLFSLPISPSSNYGILLH